MVLLLAAVAVVAVVAAADDDVFPKGLHAVDPGPLPISTPCATCHTREHDAWRASGHANAFTGERFQAAWQARPQGWCVHCHLPTTLAQRDLFPVPILAEGFVPPARVGHDGIDCIACHVRDGTILSATASATADAMHPIRADDRFPDALCADCHQFNFPLHTPTTPFAYGPTPLQDTWSEWQRAGLDRTCTDCHDPHAVPGADRSDLADHLAVLVRLEPAHAVITLSSHDVGHAVPTGDPYRALRVDLCREPACDDPVATARFGRVFDRSATTWVLATDTRVPPNGATTLRVPRSGEAQSWRLTYDLASPRHPLPGHLAARELARGRIPHGGAP